MCLWALATGRSHCQPRGVDLDRNGQRILTPAECLQVLTTTGDGRIALSEHALPIIVPVVHRVDGGTVVFGVSGGLLAAAAERGDVVCFEAGFASADATELWSVVVVGKLGLTPLESNASQHATARCGVGIVSLPMTIVSGRATTSVSA